MGFPVGTQKESSDAGEVLSKCHLRVHGHGIIDGHGTWNHHCRLRQ